MNPRGRARATGARSLLGAVVTLSLAGCFAAPPQIIALQPNQGSSGVDADAVVTVTFDREIDHASLQGRFHISPSLPGCQPESAMDAAPGAVCSIQWLANRPAFAFQHPGAVFAPNTTYTLRLDAGIRDQSGSVNGLDHTWQIRTAPAPIVRSTSPSDGDSGVPVDAAVAVQFDRPMDPVSAERAITLSPSPPEAHVVVNQLDPSRFLLLPGGLLQQGVTYRLSIAPSARDAHGQPLAQPRQISFRAGGLSTGPHVLTLAGPPGGPATTGFLSPITAAQPGDPVSAATVIAAGSTGYPGSSITAAALAPGASEVAVALRGPSGSTVIVSDPLTGRATATYAGAAAPAWSSHGSLAIVTGTGIAVRNPDGTGSDLAVPGGVTATPVWNPQGTLLALTVGTGTTSHVVLASPSLGAVYPLPGFHKPAADPVFNRAGTSVTVAVAGAGTPAAWTVAVAGGTAVPDQVASDCIPVGFTADSALMCLAGTTVGDASLVRIDSGGPTPVGGSANNAYVTSAVLSPDGRQLCYLGSDQGGVVQSWIETADGGAPTQLTAIPPATLAAQALAISP